MFPWLRPPAPFPFLLVFVPAPARPPPSPFLPPFRSAVLLCPWADAANLIYQAVESYENPNTSFALSVSLSHIYTYTPGMKYSSTRDNRQINCDALVLRCAREWVESFFSATFCRGITYIYVHSKNERNNNWMVCACSCGNAPSHHYYNIIIVVLSGEWVASFEAFHDNKANRYTYRIILRTWLFWAHDILSLQRTLSLIGGVTLAENDSRTRTWKGSITPVPCLRNPT